MRLIVSVLVVCSAWAQSTAGAGNISGVVRDASGSFVPGAKVAVSNAALGIVRRLSTNEAGVFTAGSLVPAPGYSVAVEAPGFAPWEMKDAELAVGQNLNLNVTLAVAASATQLEITAAAPLVEDTKTDVSQVIGTTEIQELPINGRRVDSFVLLTPGVSNDGTFGLLTFRGVAGGNSFLVDGNDTTEQYFNENAGRTRIATQISQDAVQEFQVLSSNFSAEYGRAMGGVVNTVTRSGGNGLHGTAYWFFRNRTLNARDRYAQVNPPEVRHQTGASLGGPIRKDKLFYFLNTDITRRNFPIASSISRPGVIENGAFVGCGAPATPAQCTAINSILPRYFGIVPRHLDQELGFGKIDWRPAERNSFSWSFNFLHAVSPNGLQTGATYTTGAGIGGNANDSVRVRNGRFSWIGIPANSIVNEFRYSWFTDRQADDYNPDLVPPGIGHISLTVAGQSNLGAGQTYLPRVLPNESRHQFSDNLAWTRGRHAVKFGADISRTDDYQYFLDNQFGFYTYGSVTAFAQDFSGNTTGAKNWQSYRQGFGNPVVDTVLTEYAFYAQDQWRITPSLTFNYGLRYEYTAVPQPTIVNPNYPQTGFIPDTKRNLAPRAGIAYSFDRQRMVFRAGYGIFFSRWSSALIQNLFQNNGVYNTTLVLNSSNAAQKAAGPVFPLTTTQSAGAVGSSTFQFADPNLRSPYTEQGTAALERQIGRHMSLTASYIWSRGVQLLAVRDLNLSLPPTKTATYTINDAAGKPVGVYASPVYTTKLDSRYGSIYYTENGKNSYYNALAVQLRRRFAAGFQGSLAYTWGHELDYGVGGGSSALFYDSDTLTTFNGNYKFDKGSGTLDQRHRLVFHFVEQPTFTHRAGAFYKYVVNNWQLAAIATLASGRPVKPSVTVSDSFPGGVFNNTLNGFGGSNRVPFLPIDYLLTQSQYRVDARLSKIVPIGERWKVYLNFEAFNVTNTPRDTSINAQAYTQRGGVLTPTAALGTGTASAGFPDGTNVRRAQVAARVVF